MQTVPGDGEDSSKGRELAVRAWPCSTQHMPEEPEHRHQLQQEDQQRAQVKPEGNVAVAQCIVDRQRKRDEGSIRAVGRKDAEGRSIGEEARQVAEAADGGVVGDGVEVVEVEAILQRVGVGRAHGRQGDDERRGRLERAGLRAWLPHGVSWDMIASLVQSLWYSCGNERYFDYWI
jgi:hypothetical protein